MVLSLFDYFNGNRCDNVGLQTQVSSTGTNLRRIVWYSSAGAYYKITFIPHFYILFCVQHRSQFYITKTKISLRLLVISSLHDPSLLLLRPYFLIYQSRYWLRAHILKIFRSNDLRINYCQFSQFIQLLFPRLMAFDFIIAEHSEISDSIESSVAFNALGILIVDICLELSL